MVELNEDARGYLTSEGALAALMSQYGSPTIASTSSAVDYGLPLVVAGLKRRAEDSAGIVQPPESGSLARHEPTGYGCHVEPNLSPHGHGPGPHRDSVPRP